MVKHLIFNLLLTLLLDTPVGTTYGWSLPVSNPTGMVTGGASLPKVISQTLTNTSDYPATLTYTVQPEFNGCKGDSFEVVITVNPTVGVDAIANQVLCNGDATQEVDFSTTIDNSNSSDFTQAGINELNDSLGSQSDWGLVGTATPNGWDGPDLEMYQTGDNEFSIYAQLTSGELKFRQDNAWATNYGDNNNDGTIESDGANIPISAGTYLIELYPSEGVYFISPYSVDIDEGTITYTWTNDNTDIGLAASGTGNIPSFVATNGTTGHRSRRFSRYCGASKRRSNCCWYFNVFGCNYQKT